MTIATCRCFAPKTQFVDLLQKCITIKRWRKPMMICNWLDKMRTKSAHSINTFCSCSVQLFQRQDADGLHIQYSPCLFFDVLSRLVSTTPPAIGRFQVTQRKLKLRCLPQTNRQATSLRLDAQRTNVLQIADNVFNIMIHTPFSSQHVKNLISAKVFSVSLLSWPNDGFPFCLLHLSLKGST